MKHCTHTETHTTHYIIIQLAVSETCLVLLYAVESTSRKQQAAITRIWLLHKYYIWWGTNRNYHRHTFCMCQHFQIEKTKLCQTEPQKNYQKIGEISKGLSTNTKVRDGNKKLYLHTQLEVHHKSSSHEDYKFILYHHPSIHIAHIFTYDDDVSFDILFLCNS